MSEQKVLLFGGTTEGRELAAWLRENNISALSHVATEYGEALLREEALPAEAGRLNEREMRELLQTGAFSAVVDATHPFATEVSRNIKEAAEEAGVFYCRVLRAAAEENEEVRRAEARLLARGLFSVFASQREAAAYLAGTEGSVFLSTGSKELSVYEALPRERLAVRILPGEEALQKAVEAKLPLANIVAMQGPFSIALNEALLQRFDARYLVSKKSGQPGSYLEKLLACERLGVCFIAIRRPAEEDGYSMEEAKALLLQRFGMREAEKEIAIVGIGPGRTGLLTAEAREAVLNAELLIGASRMKDFALALFRAAGRPAPNCADSYRPSEIAALAEETEAKRIAVLTSGDTSFFSLTRQLTKALAAREALPKPVLYPGISSLSFFAAKLGFSTEGLPSLRLHGRKQALLPVILKQRRAFAILEGAAQLDELRELAAALSRFHAGDACFHFGANLALPDEHVFSATAEDFAGDALAAEFAALPPHVLLCLYLALPDTSAARPLSPGIPDECFFREKTPLTKRQIRAAAIGLLGVREDAVCWDIGSGTGGMTAELAMAAPRGEVLAVECDAAAYALTEKNLRRFALSQVKQYFGRAPEVLAELPKPDCVFVGGSTGEMEAIFTAVFEKNPAARVVATAVSLETIAELSELGAAYERAGFRVECLQLSAAETKKLGRYHLLFGQNPTMLFLIEGGAACKN